MQISSSADHLFSDLLYLISADMPISTILQIAMRSSGDVMLHLKFFKMIKDCLFPPYFPHATPFLSHSYQHLPQNKCPLPAPA